MSFILLNSQKKCEINGNIYTSDNLIDNETARAIARKKSKYLSK